MRLLLLQVVIDWNQACVVEMAATRGLGSVTFVGGIQCRAGENGNARGRMVYSVALGSAKSTCITGIVLRLPAQPRQLRTSSRNEIVCAQDLPQQMREMRAAEKRWQSQVKDGKVKSLTPKEAGYAIDLSNFTLLDVRPSSERDKAWVKGSVWIPIFEVDKSWAPGSLLNKFSNFTMGGWWSGTRLMDYNGRFMPAVVGKIPKSANVIVVCQKGLRSLAACEQLYKAGYRNLYWINGGLDAVEEGDLNREGPDPFKFAGLGGVSQFLGWTDVQREVAKKEGLGFRVMLFGRLMAVFLGADLLFVGGRQLFQYLHGQ